MHEARAFKVAAQNVCIGRVAESDDGGVTAPAQLPRHKKLARIASCAFVRPRHTLDPVADPSKAIHAVKLRIARQGGAELARFRAVLFRRLCDDVLYHILIRPPFRSRQE
jgi:hypothetical protein